MSQALSLVLHNGGTMVAVVVVAVRRGWTPMEQVMYLSNTGVMRNSRIRTHSLSPLFEVPTNPKPTPNLYSRQRMLHSELSDTSSVGQWLALSRSCAIKCRVVPYLAQTASPSRFPATIANIPATTPPTNDITPPAAIAAWPHCPPKISPVRN